MKRYKVRHEVLKELKYYITVEPDLDSPYGEGGKQYLAVIRGPNLRHDTEQYDYGQTVEIAVAKAMRMGADKLMRLAKRKAIQRKRHNTFFE